MAEKIRNTNRFTPTMPAPVGIEYTQESINPTQKQPTEMIAEDSVTERERENMRMEDSAGNTIKLDISSVPHHAHANDHGDRREHGNQHIVNSRPHARSAGKGFIKGDGKYSG